MSHPRSAQRLLKHLQEAVSHHRAGRLDRARDDYRAALKLDPRNVDANRLLGALLLQRSDFSGARRHLRAAITAAPSDFDSHYFLGRLSFEEHHPAAAMVAFGDCLRIQPSHVDARVLLAIVQMNYGLEQAAIASLRTALQVAPKSVDALLNLAEIFLRQRQFEDAAEVMARARAVAPDLPSVLLKWPALALPLCDWRDAATFDAMARGEQMETVSDANFGQIAGSLLLPWKATAGTLRRLAEKVAPQAAREPLARPAGVVQRQRRLRVGYLSSDLRSHAVGQLFRGALAAHDRAAFDIVNFSVLPDDPADLVRQAIQAAATEVHFLDKLGGRELAETIHRARVDVLIELNGWTLHNRLRELRHRPAPVQMSYLGYTGTTGMSHIDYLIGDVIVTPPENAAEFTEAVIRLPNCYLPFDGASQPEPDVPSRAECGLPEDAVVLSGYNAAYKLTDDLADSWARILARVPASVLWLRWESDIQADNLRREFAARGIASERLVFAKREANFARHVGRQSHAALFLDSFYYNAHTTALDALWAGVPMVTKLGPSFSGRVGASLLGTLGLNELIAHSPNDYEDLAVALALDADRAAALRHRLIAARATSPLFNATQTARHLEAAYTIAWQRHCDGLPPTSFDVPASA